MAVDDDFAIAWCAGAMVDITFATSLVDVFRDPRTSRRCRAHTAYQSGPMIAWAPRRPGASVPRNGPTVAPIRGLRHGVHARGCARGGRFRQCSDGSHSRRQLRGLRAVDRLQRIDSEPRAHGRVPARFERGAVRRHRFRTHASQRVREGRRCQSRITSAVVRGNRRRRLPDRRRLDILRPGPRRRIQGARTQRYSARPLQADTDLPVRFLVRGRAMSRPTRRRRTVS
jgi:hypothetical protein